MQHVIPPVMLVGMSVITEICVVKAAAAHLGYVLMRVGVFMGQLAIYVVLHGDGLEFFGIATEGVIQ